MIIGLGIDSIEIERFTYWHTYSNQQLLRIFSKEEVEYCLKNGVSSAERFAARFATREAFFKAIQTAYPSTHIPFLSVCRAISLSHAGNNSPTLKVDWPTIRKITGNLISIPLTSLISVTHTRTTATVCILLQK